MKAKLKVKKEVKAKAVKAEPKAEKMTKWDFKRREAKLFGELETACANIGESAVEDSLKKLAKLRKRYHGQFKAKKTEN